MTVLGLAMAAGLAATPLTVSDVRTLSREKNSAALLAELTHANTEQQQRVARAVIFPQLQLSASTVGSYFGPQSYYSSAVPAADGTFHAGVVQVPESSFAQYGLSLTLNQILYDGGKWWNAIAQASALERVASRQLEEQRNVSEYEGVRRFYELLRAQKSMAVLDATVTRSRDQLERARALYEAGHAPKNDVYAAQVNLGNDQIAFARQRSAVAGAQADLAAWIAWPGDSDLSASEPADWGRTGNRSQGLGGLVSLARSRRPLLLALADQVHATELGIAVSRAGFLPRLSLFGTAGRLGPSVDPTLTDPSKQNYLTGGVQLQWDLFSGFGTTAQEEQARLAKLQAEVNLIEAGREVEADVKRTLAALSASEETRGLADSNQTAAQDGLSLAGERYKAGAGSQLEVQDAQLKLTQAELTAVSARIDVDIARANVARVLGTSEWE